MAPCFAQNSEVATPVRARPMTKIFFPRSSNMLPVSYLSELRGARLNLHAPAKSSTQLQRRQGEQREDERGNPKPHDDFGFAPTQQFEMVMNRRHAEDAFSAQLERANLKNHAERLDDKNSADKK